MKVLQINNYYDCGSTGKITKDIHEFLLDINIDSKVIYGRGSSDYKNNSIYKVSNELYSKFNNLFSRFSGKKFSGCFFSTNKIISIIKNEKPDIVHIQCINCFFVNMYRLLDWLKRNNYKTIITLHAEFMYTGGCNFAPRCSQWQTGCTNCLNFRQVTNSYFFNNVKASFSKLKNIYSNFNNLTIVPVSNWQCERVKQSPLLNDKNITTILNGVNNKIFYYKKDTTINIPNNYKKVVLHVTPYFTNLENNKGGKYILELAKRNKDILFLVVGRYSSINDLPNNIVLLGEIFDQNLLSEYYSIADCFLLTSEFESFSMTTIESLCCGTPVVGFECGGANSIALKDYSTFVKYGDVISLEKEMLNMLNYNWNKQLISTIAAKYYSKDIMCAKYLELYLEGEIKNAY